MYTPRHIDSRYKHCIVSQPVLISCYEGVVSVTMLLLCMLTNRVCDVEMFNSQMPDVFKTCDYVTIKGHITSIPSPHSITSLSFIKIQDIQVHNIFLEHFLAYGSFIETLCFMYHELFVGSS